MRERSGVTPGISSADKVGALSECFFLLSNSYIKKNYEMENIFLHTPSQTIQKSRQFVTQSIP